MDEILGVILAIKLNRLTIDEILMIINYIQNSVLHYTTYNIGELQNIINNSVKINQKMTLSNMISYVKILIGYKDENINKMLFELLQYL